LGVRGGKAAAHTQKEYRGGGGAAPAPPPEVTLLKPWYAGRAPRNVLHHRGCRNRRTVPGTRAGDPPATPVAGLTRGRAPRAVARPPAILPRWGEARGSLPRRGNTGSHVSSERGQLARGDATRAGRPRSQAQVLPQV